jgi:hypothetical protein
MEHRAEGIEPFEAFDGLSAGRLGTSREPFDRLRTGKEESVIERNEFRMTRDDGGG